ncbi:tyrosine kinase family protein [Mycobacterium kansasii 732]|uniref:protein kinase domain-containing protein n=1 Tax=Mycobacterium pseudokansasii TaxID=2341080 RepID=UPI0004536A16|nr:protein kinase [Mycobacterium pseudokansasii]EUA09987.1 tyrosine kinase family protein [Mycobacterium kansasii 732]
MSVEVGQVFAGYTILRALGTGGMGQVYVAAHPRLPREEAVKIPPAELTGDPEYRARFEREADLAASLHHRNIVRIHDRGECEGRLWISMEYVAGTDVAQLLRQQYPGEMPLDAAAPIITAVGSALGARLCASSRVISPRCQTGKHLADRTRWGTGEPGFSC